MKPLPTILALLLSLVAAAGCSGAQSSSERPETSVARPDRVKVQFYVMSQCPYGAQVLNSITPVMKEIGEYVSLKIDYIGRIEGDRLTSMHGQAEVEGDIVELCAMKHEPGRYLDLFSCVNKNRAYRKLPGNWEPCAKEVELDDAVVGKIKACFEGKEGKDLLRASFEKAQKARASGSPTIKIAGKYFRGGRKPVHFMRAICAEIKADKPEPCTKLPPEVTVKLTVLGDKRCTLRNCRTRHIIGSLKGHFPKMDVKELDYGTDEGKAFFAEHKLKHLPAFVFGEDVKESPGHGRVGRYLKPTEKKGFFSLQIGASFDPTAEICDNKKDDTGNGKVDCDDDTCKDVLICREEIPGKLDVFVMSMCPFAVRALNAMEEVLEAFGDDIKFNVHYIASEKGDGFWSLHGQPEVDENIRQLCAIKHYPKLYMKYILCRNKTIMKKDMEWKKCVSAGMDVRVIEECATSDEGKNLLRKDIKIGEALRISGSPTWLLNNKSKFSGGDARTIQTNICKQNKDFKGCEKPLSGPPSRYPGCGDQGGGSCGD